MNIIRDDVGRLDVYVDDDSIKLSKNFGADNKDLVFNLDNDSNRLFVEFIDLIINPGKRDLFIHDNRHRNVYSSIAFCIDHTVNVVKEKGYEKT